MGLLVLPSCCDRVTCQFAPAATLCRAAEHQCDAGGICTGDSTDCPPNENVPNLTPCNDGVQCTLEDACINGVCVGRVSECACDVTADCASTNNPCTYAECVNRVCTLRNNDSTTTCTDNNVCTANDKCDGTGVCQGSGISCAHLDTSCSSGRCFRGVGGGCIRINIWGSVCRATSGVACDRNETCTGLSSTCPVDTGTSCLNNSVVRCTLGVTYEVAAPTAATDRVCTPVSPPCASDEFQSSAPTLTSDRVCRPSNSTTPAPPIERSSGGAGAALPIIGAVIAIIALVALVVFAVLWRRRQNGESLCGGGARKRGHRRKQQIDPSAMAINSLFLENTGGGGGGGGGGGDGESCYTAYNPIVYGSGGAGSAGAGAGVRPGKNGRPRYAFGGATLNETDVDKGVLLMTDRTRVAEDGDEDGDGNGAEMGASGHGNMLNPAYEYNVLGPGGMVLNPVYNPVRGNGSVSSNDWDYMVVKGDSRQPSLSSVSRQQALGENLPGQPQERGRGAEMETGMKWMGMGMINEEEGGEKGDMDMGGVGGIPVQGYWPLPGETVVDEPQRVPGSSSTGRVPPPVMQRRDRAAGASAAAAAPSTPAHAPSYDALYEAAEPEHGGGIRMRETAFDQSQSGTAQNLYDTLGRRAPPTLSGGSDGGHRYSALDGEGSDAAASLHLYDSLDRTGQGKGQGQGQGNDGNLYSSLDRPPAPHGNDGNLYSALDPERPAAHDGNRYNTLDPQYETHGGGAQGNGNQDTEHEYGTLGGRGTSQLPQTQGYDVLEDPPEDAAPSQRLPLPLPLLLPPAPKPQSRGGGAEYAVYKGRPDGVPPPPPQQQPGSTDTLPPLRPAGSSASGYAAFAGQVDADASAGGGGHHQYKPVPAARNAPVYELPPEPDTAFGGGGNRAAVPLYELPPEPEAAFAAAAVPLNETAPELGSEPVYESNVGLKAAMPLYELPPEPAYEVQETVFADNNNNLPGPGAAVAGAHGAFDTLPPLPAPRNRKGAQ